MSIYLREQNEPKFPPRSFSLLLRNYTQEDGLYRVEHQSLDLAVEYNSNGEGALDKEFWFPYC